MHLDRGEGAQDFGHIRQARPVELKVLARREVSVSLVPYARDVREHVQLARGQRAIGNGNPKHIGMKLQVQAVHQAQRLEFVFRQLARQASRNLSRKLLDALVNSALVELVIPVHQAAACLPRSRRTLGPAARMISRCLTGRRWSPVW